MVMMMVIMMMMMMMVMMMIIIPPTASSARLRQQHFNQSSFHPEWKLVENQNINRFRETFCQGDHLHRGVNSGTVALAPATAADDLPTVPRPNFSNCQAILQHRDDDDNNVVEDERTFCHE